MAYEPNVATFLLVSSCGKTLGKKSFLNIPFKSASLATSQIRTRNLFMVR